MEPYCGFLPVTRGIPTNKPYQTRTTFLLIQLQVNDEYIRVQQRIQVQQLNDLSSPVWNTLLEHFLPNRLNLANLHENMLTNGLWFLQDNLNLLRMNNQNVHTPHLSNTLPTFSPHHQHQCKSLAQRQFFVYTRSEEKVRMFHYLAIMVSIINKCAVHEKFEHVTYSILMKINKNLSYPARINSPFFRVGIVHHARAPGWRN